MIRIALELRDSPYNNRGLLKFSRVAIDKLSKFFQYQIYTGGIRKINPRIAAYNIFCVIFESITSWKFYSATPNDLMLIHI